MIETTSADNLENEPLTPEWIMKVIPKTEQAGRSSSGRRRSLLSWQNGVDVIVWRHDEDNVVSGFRLFVCSMKMRYSEMTRRQFLALCEGLGIELKGEV